MVIESGDAEALAEMLRWVMNQDAGLALETALTFPDHAGLLIAIETGGRNE